MSGARRIEKPRTRLSRWNEECEINEEVVAATKGASSLDGEETIRCQFLRGKEMGARQVQSISE